MFVPQTVYTQIALDALTRELKIHLPHQQRTNFTIPQEFYSLRKGCFVSIHTLDGELRGCIGTLYPQEKNIIEEISRNAKSAAFRDTRFSPLHSNEMGNVDLSVDVLTTPEKVFSKDDLDPQIFGVIVSDDQLNRAVLLPGIEGIESVDKQLKIVKRKAGICMNTPWQELQIERFTSNRYR